MRLYLERDLYLKSMAVERCVSSPQPVRVASPIKGKYARDPASAAPF